MHISCNIDALGGRYPRREEYVKEQDAARANRIFRGTRPEQ